MLNLVLLQEEPDEYEGNEAEEDENYQDIVDDEQFGYGKTRGANRHAAEAFNDPGTRRSARTSAAANTKSNGKRPAADDWSQWKGERRSTRLGAPDTTQDVHDAPVVKRARTEESSVSAHSDTAPLTTSQSKKSAAALKPTEFALDQVAGKKRSKFWFYAVEPVAGAPTNGAATNGNGKSESEPPGSSNAEDLGEEMSDLSAEDE